MGSKADIVGVGLGLRFAFVDDVLWAIEKGERLPGVAFFEVSPENHMRRGGYIPAALARIREHYALLSHGLTLSVGGLDPFDPEYMGELRRFLERIDAPFHSDHLCFSGAKGAILHDLLPLPLCREAAVHAASRLREAADRLERPVAVENISHYLHLGRPSIDEADFLGEVLEKSGMPLVIDVNNVYVNAQNHGFDALAFLERLPLERVVQIHVAGHEFREEEGLYIDTHGADTCSQVLDLLAWVIERTGPLPVLLERDHAIPEFPLLLDEVRRVESAYARGLSAFIERKRGFGGEP